MLGDPEEARKLIHPGKHGELLREHVVEAAPLEDTLHITLARSPVAADAVIALRLLAPAVFHNLCRLPAERDIKGAGARVSDVGPDDEAALPRRWGARSGRLLPSGPLFISRPLPQLRVAFRARAPRRRAGRRLPLWCAS